MNGENSDGRKILVVDDEKMLRDLVARFLTRRGYQVTTACEGLEGLYLYQKAQFERPFDVVIIDLMMPNGMGGDETIRRLLEVHPEVKAIISSACDPGHRVLANYKDYGFVAAVRKPLNYDLLITTIDDLISEKACIKAPAAEFGWS